jgi:hypothetical protein
MPSSRPRSPHSFLGINMQGRSCVVRTAGNRYGHLVLRGGGGRPNYDTVSVALAEAALAKARLADNLVVDCSHANSYKRPELQPLVMQDCVNQVIAQRKSGHRSIVGLMIESFIEAGNQPIPDPDPRPAQVRLLGHRRLRRLVDHRNHDPRRRHAALRALPTPDPTSEYPPMSLIRPFRGLRPAPGRASDVAAPPYDVLSSDEARVRAAGKPWSFLHISKPEIDLPPTPIIYAPEVYAKAAENLRKMLDAGILVRDDSPATTPIG